MTTFDYALNVALIGLVLLQLRGRRLDRRGLLLPLGLVLWAASRYLHGIPTDGNDGVIVGAGLLAGAALGTWSALLTRLHRGADGVAVARATAGAALLWVLGIGSRMAFALYTQYGGAPTVARFSIAHRLTGPAGHCAGADGVRRGDQPHADALGQVTGAQHRTTCPSPERWLRELTDG